MYFILSYFLTVTFKTLATRQFTQSKSHYTLNIFHEKKKN
jgi:hypothetical protein